MVLLFCPAHYAIFFHLSILALNNVDWLKAWVCVAPEAIHLVGAFLHLRDVVTICWAMSG